MNQAIPAPSSQPPSPPAAAERAAELAGSERNPAQTDDSPDAILGYN